MVSRFIAFSDCKGLAEGLKQQHAKLKPSLGLEQIKFIVTWVDFCLNESHIKISRFGSESTQRITGTTNEVPGCLSLINLWHPVASVSQWFKLEENTPALPILKCCKCKLISCKIYLQLWREILTWEFECS